MSAVRRRLRQSGAPGVAQAGATPVVSTPTQTAAEVATAIATAISASPLNILATANGNIVDLPAGAQFAPNGTPLTPAGIWPISYSSDDSPAAVAGSIQDAIGRAFAPVTITANLLNAEANDRLATAVDIGLPGGAARFTASGFIGDNPAFPLQAGIDVDYMKLNLRAGETIVIRANASTLSALQPALRLFDSTGHELASTQASLSPQLSYNVLTTGTYYLAVSSASNLGYEANHDGSADVRLQIPAQGGAVGGLTDGERFTIDDGAGGPPRVFEFDSNGQLFSPGAIPISLADVLLQVPSAGTSPGGIRDGDTLVINDNRGSGDVVFEFDTNSVISPGNVRIAVAANASATSVALALASSLANANIGLSPSLQGTTGVRLGTVNHSVSVLGTPTLNRVSLPVGPAADCGVPPRRHSRRPHRAAARDQLWRFRHARRARPPRRHVAGSQLGPDRPLEHRGLRRQRRCGSRPQPGSLRHGQSPESGERGNGLSNRTARILH